jgi:hypothetical protein
MIDQNLIIDAICKLMTETGSKPVKIVMHPDDLDWYNRQFKSPGIPVETDLECTPGEAIVTLQP